MALFTRFIEWDGAVYRLDSEKPSGKPVGVYKWVKGGWIPNNPGTAVLLYEGWGTDDPSTSSGQAPSAGSVQAPSGGTSSDKNES